MCVRSHFLNPPNPPPSPPPPPSVNQRDSPLVTSGKGNSPGRSISYFDGLHTHFVRPAHLRLRPFITSLRRRHHVSVPSSSPPRPILEQKKKTRGLVILPSDVISPPRRSTRSLYTWRAHQHRRDSLRELIDEKISPWIVFITDAFGFIGLKTHRRGWRLQRYLFISGLCSHVIVASPRCSFSGVCRIGLQELRLILVPTTSSPDPLENLLC